MAATAAIALAGGGVDGELDGVGLEPGALGVGLDGLGSPMLPVQATPLTVNAAGAVLVPVQLPVKPNETVPLVAIAA
jgi:hypothetical protein